MHYDWLKLFTWLAVTKHSILFQTRVISILLWNVGYEIGSWGQYHKQILAREGVVAQLVEESLPIPEVHGSTAVIGKINQLFWKDENK